MLTNTEIEFSSFGGINGEVTGSKHQLRINDRYILIDYGAWQGSQDIEKLNSSFRLPFDLNKIETVIVSHAHLDHCGLLPKLIVEKYKGPIYSTPATRDLAFIVLADSAKIQTYSSLAPYFKEKDVIETIDRFKCYRYEKKKQISSNVAVTFYNAGHILGSSLVNIEVTSQHLFSKQKTNILFSGDLGRQFNTLLNTPETNFESPIDYLVLESTYGNKEHTDFGYALQNFSDIINITIARQGKVIIPVFAIERAQEIIYYIKMLMNSKQIPRVPVFLDSPMSVNATGVFNIHPECFNQNIQDKYISKGKNPFSIGSLQFITEFGRSLKLAKTDKPCIILASSGMCEGGHILNHLQFGLENPLNTILFVGYQAENTRGARILNREDIYIDNKKYDIKADINSINAFSAHADSKDILTWLKKIDTSKLKKIFLVHGEAKAQISLQKLLESHGFKTEIVCKTEKYKL